jgi:GDP-4-dehydro-6-deoxy-D-mannose reductase
VRIWVTGARGFVGKHLVPRLVDQGWEVSGTDLDLDVSDRVAVAQRLQELNPDAIIHLAAQSSVAASKADPELTYRVNYLGSLSILQGAAACAKKPRVVLIGTADQYGTREANSEPLTEDSPFRPNSPYAHSKAEADQLGATFASKGLPVVRVRAFSHTGAGQTDAFVLSSFARQAAEIEAGIREPVLRVGNLDSVRDFLDVEDVVDAYLRLLDPQLEVAAYNVSSGVGVRLGELLDMLLDRLPDRPKIEIDPARVRPTDYSVGDSSRLRGATGWAPRVPIERTLEGLLDYWRKKINAS